MLLLIFSFFFSLGGVHRPKVQAQRKFAQVCGGSASSTLPSSLLANQSSQNGSAKVEAINHDPPQELLPNRRPNTEDFLTFLCFRGTSVLPSHLDFFNTNKNVDHQQVKPKVEVSAPSCSTKETKSDDKRVSIKNDKTDTNNDACKKETVEPPKFIPFAVRKRADTVAAGSRKQTVQALKKKYQDQRIAKNKAQCQTRSSTAKETTETIETTEITCKMQKSRRNENEAKNTANVGPDKSQIKRKLRGTIGSNQPDDEPIVGKSPKIVKDTSKETNKDSSSKEVKKDSNKDASKDAKVESNKDSNKVPSKDTEKSQKTPDVNKVIVFFEYI